MNEESGVPNLTNIDFNNERTYAFLKIKDKAKRDDKYKIFFDEAKRRGKDHLFSEKVEALQEEEAPATAYEVNSRGIPLKIWENLKVLYDNKGIELKYNELKKTIESNHTWYMYEDFLTQINSDCKRTGLTLSKDDLWGFTAYIANRKAYNPVKSYLEAVHQKYKNQGKQTKELEKLFKTITYPSYYTAKDRAFNQSMLLKWLVTGVKMGLNDGSYNAEFTLVFKGKQGLGKTRWFRSLMPKEYLIDFFKDGIQLDLSKKDDIIQSTSYWLCELGELGGTMKKSDRDALKAWLTSTHDEFRTPYSRKAEKYPRRSFFACTVNDNQFLRDSTGNRRFVVVDVEKLDHTHTVDIDLLWGEIMELFMQGERTYLNQEEIEYNNHRNKDYMVKSDEQILIEEYLPFEQPQEEWGYITSTGICDYMQVEHGKNLKPQKIGKALSAMGYEQENVRVKEKRGRFYKLPFLNKYSIPF